MTTAKKVAAKAAPKKAAKTPPKKAVATTPVKQAVQREQEFSMPMEVKDWIDQAMSRLKSLQSKVDRLEAENKELKSYKRWAEHRILNSSPE
jgi:hypothetical protein